MLTHVGTITIETKRLILRRFEYSDIDSMIRNWIADEQTQLDYGEPGYSTPEAVRELFDTKYIVSYARNDYYRWAVIEKGSQECIGQIAYFSVDTDNQHGEIEYVVGPAFQGKGYATEMTRAVIAFGFEKINFNRIEIDCRTENEASRRVIEKCGLTYEGVFRDFFWRKDHFEGRRVFSILKSEWDTKNPWEKISLETYEQHMSLDSVKQLQVMNRIMKDQFEEYPVETVMILGIAGGNGLEHINPKKYRKVYGVDINELYLRETIKRYPNLSGILNCLHLDIVAEADKLPHSDLVVANILIEYIGYDAFVNAINRIDPTYVSCVIQVNTDEEKWVSDSPYLHAFDGLDEIHHQMESGVLNLKMMETGFALILQDTKELPNGKALMRLDYQRTE
ncbi:MAG: GNAT family N-acetyltransferase [Lachnospiraceae bacterium]|nr:GNAT family N-acetyltransferase [Lachnospiraceae bacterium]